MPFAPGLFSTTNCWPQLSESFCPTSRAMVSGSPPGEYPTTTFTGLSGKLFAPCASAACAAAIAAKASRPPIIRTIECMQLLRKRKFDSIALGRLGCDLGMPLAAAHARDLGRLEQAGLAE